MGRHFEEVVATKIWHPTLQKFITNEEFKALQTAVNVEKEIDKAEEQWRKNRAEKMANGPARKPSTKQGDEDMSSKKSNEKMKKAVAEKMKPKKESKTIIAIVKENPYRKDSNGEKKFAHILKAGAKGISMADYLKAGGQSSDISWGKAHDYLKVI